MKGYSIYIDFRKSSTWDDDIKVNNIKTLYDAFRNYKTNVDNHFVDYISFIGDAVMIMVKSGDNYYHFIEVIKEIDKIVDDVMDDTDEMIGIGFAYGEYEKINDNKGAYIVASSVDSAAFSSSLGNKTTDKTWVIKHSIDGNNWADCNQSLYDIIKEWDINEEIELDETKKYFYFDLLI